MTNFSLFTIVQISIAAVFEIFSKILHGPNNKYLICIRNCPTVKPRWRRDNFS